PDREHDQVGDEQGAGHAHGPSTRHEYGRSPLGVQPAAATFHPPPMRVRNSVSPDSRTWALSPHTDVSDTRPPSGGAVPIAAVHGPARSTAARVAGASSAQRASGSPVAKAVATRSTSGRWVAAHPASIAIAAPSANARATFMIRATRAGLRRNRAAHRIGCPVVHVRVNRAATGCLPPART